MNPHKMNKVDMSAMNEQDKKAFQMYGKLPAKNLLTKMQKDRKYFDSGDYMMNKAGVQSAQAPGTAIPTPEGLPHAFSPSPVSPPPSGSPPMNIPLPASGLNNQANKQSSPTQGTGGWQPERLSPSQGVGVGISPAATSEAMDMPGGGPGHVRRTSESHNRTSPPAILREGSMPSSSFPIQHHNSFGSSPVKTSNLGKRLDEEA